MAEPDAIEQDPDAGESESPAEVAPRRGPALPDIQAQVDAQLAASARQAVSVTRTRGRSPAAAHLSVVRAQAPGSAPPAVNLSTAPPVPDSSIPSEELVSKAPVLAQKLAESPGTAATVGSNDETLKLAVNSELAFKSKYDEMDTTAAPAPTQEAGASFPPGEASGLVSAVKNVANPVAAAYWKSRMDMHGFYKFLGNSNPDVEVDYQQAKKNYLEYSKQDSNVVGRTLGMAEPLIEQGLEAAAATYLTQVPLQYTFAAAAGASQTGASFNEFRETPTADGTPIRDNVARAGAAIVGGLTALTFGGGGAIVKSGLGPLVAELGGTKVLSGTMASLVRAAFSSPGFSGQLLKLGASAGSSTVALKLFNLANVIAHDAGVREMAALQPTVQVDTPEEVAQKMKDALTNDTPEQLLFGVFGGLAHSGYAKLAKTADDYSHSVQFRDKGVPALTALAQSEAGTSPDYVHDLVASQEETHGDPEVHQAMSVPVEQLRQVQKDVLAGKPLHPDLEKRAAAAEATGTDVVLPTSVATSRLLTQKGADRLAPYLRVGDAPTLDEQAKADRAVKESTSGEGPSVDEETEKVANDLKTKMLARGDTAYVAEVKSQVVAESLRVASLEKARSLGQEPTVFEDYAKGPLEISGGRRKALSDFDKSLEQIQSATEKEERLAGSPEAEREKAQAEAKAKEKGETYSPKTPLQKLQEAAAKKLGQTFLAYRVEGKEREVGPLSPGEAYLDPEVALQKAGAGQEVVPAYLRPEDLTGARKGGVVTSGEIAPERLRPMSEAVLRKLMAEETPNADEEDRGRFLNVGGKFFQSTLTGKADQSTFLHEAWHYLEKRWEDLSPETLRPLQEWSKGDKETSAEAVEKYFTQGEAPNKNLRATFQTLARWMEGVYGPMREMVPLDEDVKRTLDRFFAVKEEIDEAGKVLGLDESAFETGFLTPEELVKYRDALTAAKETALEGGYEKAGRFGRAKAREEFQKHVDRVEQLVNTDDANNAYSWLTEGKTLDGRDVGLDWQKLNYDEVKGLGYDPTDGPLRNIVEKKGDSLLGYSPDAVAQLFDFHNGRELLEFLQRHEPLDEQTKKLAESTFDAAEPGWNSHDDWVKATGMQEVHGAALGKLRKMEMRLIGDRLGFKNGGERAAAAIDMKVRDVVKGQNSKDLKPSNAFRGEARAIAKMKEALGKNDFEEAWRQSNNAYAAMRMYIEQSKEKSDLGKNVAKMKDAATNNDLRARINKGGREYQTIMDWVLENTGFKKMEPMQTPVEKEDVEKALKTLSDRGEAFYWPNTFSEPAGFLPWQRMPLPDLKNAFDVVEQAKTQALNNKELVTADRRASVTEVATNVVNDMTESTIRKDKVSKEPLKERDLKPLKNIEKIIKSVGLSLDRPEAILRTASGGEAGALANTEIVHPVFRAYGRFADRSVESNKYIASEIQKPVSGESLENYRKRMVTKVPVPWSGNDIYTQDVLSIIGHMGDPDAIERFTRGERTTYKAIQNWMSDLLHKKQLLPGDFEKVGRLQKHIESYRGEVFDVAERVNGIRPKTIEPSPFVVDGPDGPVRYEGGYWPFKYDAERDENSVLGKSTEEMLSQGNSRQAVNVMDNFIRERSSQGLNVPLEVGLEPLANRVQQMIRYAELREPLENARKLIQEPIFKDFMQKKWGGWWGELDNWVKRMASSQAGGIPYGMEGWNHFFRYLKAGTNAFLYTLKPLTSIHQLSGIVASTRHTGALSMVQGGLDLLTHLPSEFKRIQTESREVGTAGHMKQSMWPERAIQDAINRTNPSVAVRGGQALSELGQKYGMMFMSGIQKLSSTIAYKGMEVEMNKRLNKEMVDFAKENPGAEIPARMDATSEEGKQRIRDASDEVVRAAHGASEFKDLPSFYANRPWALAMFNPVANYHNVLFNHLREMGVAVTEHDIGRFVSIGLTQFAAAAVFSGFVRGEYSDDKREKGESDEEHVGRVAIKDTMQQFIGTVPFVGDEVNHLLSIVNPYTDVHLFGNSPFTFPLLDSLDKAAEHSKRALQRERKGKEFDEKSQEAFLHDASDIFTETNPWHVSTKVPLAGWEFLHRAWNGQVKWDDTSAIYAALKGNPPPKGKKK